jgi:pimeloyl-ACP methyl ester carboxylesterase
MLVIVSCLLIGLAIGAIALGYTPDKPRAVLEAKYLSSPADYVEAAGIRLHVRDTGPRNAPILVFIHGFGSSLQTWDAWADTLSANFRVIRYDLPGFALTGPDPTNDYSETRGVQVLAALLDRLNVARATLIGNSIGGKLAWEFAARHPQRVEALALISPDGFASPGFAYGKPAHVPALLKLMPYFLPKALVRMSLVPAYGDPAALSYATLTRYWDLMRAPGVRKAMIARLQQTVLENPESFLRAIQAPTLLIWGEKDAMIPFANAADYQRLIAVNSLAALPGLGHVPQEEAPAASLRPLQEFLRRNAASSVTPVR